MLHRLLDPRRAARSARGRWQGWAAIRQARRVHRSNPAAIRVCWDLDNTLVDSGTLIHAGRTLRDAVVEAKPIPNMFEFYETMRSRLPEADHFILSARVRSMRHDTLIWLTNHGFVATHRVVCFVPSAAAKAKVWQQLARDARLVIIDDLTYDHESKQPSTYDDLVTVAKRTACVYIGLQQIAEIAEQSAAVETIADDAVKALVECAGPTHRPSA